MALTDSSITSTSLPADRLELAYTHAEIEAMPVAERHTRINRVLALVYGCNVSPRLARQAVEHADRQLQQEGH